MSGFDFTSSVGFANPVDNPVLLTSGQKLLDPVLETAPMDVRAYNSIVFIWNIWDDLGLGVWNDSFWVELRGYENEADALADSNRIYCDDLCVYGDNMPGWAGGYPVSFYTPVFAPWYTLYSLDRSYSDTYMIDYRFLGSYRSVPNLLIRHPDGGSSGGTTLVGSMTLVLAAGATENWSCYLGYGRARLRLYCGTAPSRVRIRDSFNWVIVELTAPTNTFTYTEFIATKNQMYCEVTNTGAIQATVDFDVVLDQQSF